MALPSPPETRRPHGFGSGVLVGVGVALVAAVVAVGTVLALNDGGAKTAASPTASASPSTSPSASPTPERPPAQIKSTFQGQDWLKGERLWLSVVDFDLNAAECSVHVYKVRNKMRGAFQSDCSSWERDGYDILLFYVALRNPARRPFKFNLRNFVLTARDTRTFGPVNVRSEAEFPPSFLPETGTLPPRSNLVGYLTFDGRVTSMVPARISYVNGQQTLVVLFEGKHSIN